MKQHWPAIVKEETLLIIVVLLVIVTVGLDLPETVGQGLLRGRDFTSL